MKKIKDQNICVRVDRNEQQISRCKERIEGINDFIQDFSQILQLAGNEVRMKILILLREEKRLCVCDLGEVLDMKTPAVSQHLRKLKDTKLVYTEREGTVIYYSISQKMRPILDVILNLIPQSVLS